MFCSMRLPCLTTSWTTTANSAVKTLDCPAKEEPLATKMATKTPTAARHEYVATVGIALLLSW
jgi:hypothetical protein